jgi:hypothetical protein
MHQLVLQFAANSLRDYDDLVALEQQLVAELGESEVDGHDMGSGEANIFILTADAKTTFRRLLPVLQRSGRLPEVTVAYRRTDENRYHVLWPEASSREFSVA